MVLNLDVYDATIYPIKTLTVCVCLCVRACVCNLHLKSRESVWVAGQAFLRKNKSDLRKLNQTLLGLDLIWFS